ncbi:Transcription factor IIIA [Folsomia candida]|uniref:Transcription factor IIIA n=2 Tax=Folsomia candida TaxID=158441 RepID=A0A226E0T5_FOLCA|nr:Transcription factor IIIA [Folsomia candida]
MSSSSGAARVQKVVSRLENKSYVVTGGIRVTLREQLNEVELGDGTRKFIILKSQEVESCCGEDSSTQSVPEQDKIFTLIDTVNNVDSSSSENKDNVSQQISYFTVTKNPRKRKQTFPTTASQPKAMKIFSCSSCAKKFNNKQGFERHEHIHDGELYCPEPGCDVSFKNITSVTKHRIEIHNYTNPLLEARRKAKKTTQEKEDSAQAHDPEDLVATEAKSVSPSPSATSPFEETGDYTSSDDDDNDDDESDDDYHP